MTHDSTDKPQIEYFAVLPDCAGLRLDVALHRLVEFIPSRSFAQRLIDCNAVTVNGKARRASWSLMEGDQIEVDVSALRPPSSTPQPQNIHLDVLFEDHDLLVLNKPAGLVVHPGAGVPDGTLVNAVLAHTGLTLPCLGDDPLRAGIVHRLDRDTSGVMVVAKTQLALSGLSQQFSQHSQLRRYRALVFGVPDRPFQTVETWHGRDPKNRLKYAVLPEGQGKIARMTVRVDRVYAGDQASAVICELYTGRTHQIRVQLSSLKHGLLGDSLYGQAAAPESSGVPALIRDKVLWAKIRELATRQMLHAMVLGFRHPATGDQLNFECEPPEDFKRLEKFLSELV
jgi:23S rRNA pseudouridine1911/1915/1917 synthase